MVYLSSAKVKMTSSAVFSSRSIIRPMGSFILSGTTWTAQFHNLQWLHSPCSSTQQKGLKWDCENVQLRFINNNFTPTMSQNKLTPHPTLHGSLLDGY